MESKEGKIPTDRNFPKEIKSLLKCIKRDGDRAEPYTEPHTRRMVWERIHGHLAHVPEQTTIHDAKMSELIESGAWLYGIFCFREPQPDLPDTVLDVSWLTSEWEMPDRCALPFPSLNNYFPLFTNNYFPLFTYRNRAEYIADNVNTSFPYRYVRAVTIRSLLKNETLHRQNRAGICINPDTDNYYLRDNWKVETLPDKYVLNSDGKPMRDFGYGEESNLAYAVGNHRMKYFEEIDDKIRQGTANGEESSEALSSIQRKFLLTAYHNFGASYIGKIEKISKKGHICFSELFVDAARCHGMYMLTWADEYTTFLGKEHHIWVKNATELLATGVSVGDCVQFEGDPYVYTRRDGSYDMSVKNIYLAKQVNAYALPSDEFLLEQNARLYTCKRLCPNAPFCHTSNFVIFSNTACPQCGQDFINEVNRAKLWMQGKAEKPTKETSSLKDLRFSLPTKEWLRKALEFEMARLLEKGKLAKAPKLLFGRTVGGEQRVVVFQP